MRNIIHMQMGKNQAPEWIRRWKKMTVRSVQMLCVASLWEEDLHTHAHTWRGIFFCSLCIFDDDYYWMNAKYIYDMGLEVRDGWALLKKKKYFLMSQKCRSIASIHYYVLRITYYVLLLIHWGCFSINCAYLAFIIIPEDKWFRV